MGILRLLFALSVATSHTQGGALKFFNPYGSVLSFFIISGFYIALILDHKYTSKIAFYLSRSLRLYPVYWIALVITLALGIAKTTFFKGDSNAIMHYLHYSKHLNGADFVIETVNYIFRNVTLIFSKDYFGLRDNRAPEYLILYQGWTLPIELVFYFFAPFILKIKQNLFFFVCVYFILFYGIILPFKFIPETSLTFTFLLYLFYFLLGVVSYRYIYLNIKNIILPNEKKIVSLLLIALIIFIFAFQRLHLESFFGSFGLSMLFYHIPLAFFISFAFKMYKDNKFDKFLGEMSYPVYMTHFIFIKLFDPFPMLARSIPGTAIIIGSTLLFSGLLIRFIQTPIDRFRHRKFRK